LIKHYKRTHGDSPEKNGSLALRFSRSLKVIETDTNRWDTYDFRLVIHSSHGPILYHFQDIARY